MLANVLYILPMLLGRTYDARFDRVGIDIFPQSQLDLARVLEEPSSMSRYETSDSAEEVRNLLEVSADLALKVKAGKLDFKGTGSYLRDTSKLGRMVEILTRLKFTTVTIALPPEVKPFPSWATKNRNDLGTHFVRSITYGGELLASIRFKANKDSDFNYINAEIQNNFNGGDPTNLVAEGKLEKLQSNLKDRASMEISYYATVPLKGVPNTIEGLRSLVNGFGAHVEEVNDGRGVPIRVELMELSSLGGVNSSEFTFMKDKVLEAELSDVEHEFDDLRKASNMVREWYRTLPLSITPVQEAQINRLNTRIQNILRPYYDGIGKLNIEEGPEKQVQAAREAYREGKISALPGKFTKEFMKLKKKIVVVEKKLYGTGTGTYNQWGSKDCPKSPMIHQIHTGVMASTTNRGTGGGSDYLCLPDKPQLYPKDPDGFLSTASSIMAGVKYGLLDDHPFENKDARYFFGRGVPCAMCHLTNRTLIHTFPAIDECPEDWILEYSGYLMGGSNIKGIHFCIDENPEAIEQNTEEQQTHSLSIEHISSNDYGLPKPPYVKTAAVKCVVCSR